MSALWCVPAMGDCGDSFAPLFATQLATRFKLWAPDLPGAGAATAESGALELDGVADWLVRIIGHASGFRAFTTGRRGTRQGGHWPMIEQPEETARQIARFFQPLFPTGEVTHD